MTDPTAPPLAWTPTPPAPPLTPGELHLWRLDPPAAEPDAAALALLSDAERERAAGLRNPQVRGQFIHTRAAKRHILGAYLGLAPRAVRFTRGPHGKPYLDGPGPWFNLTHSGPLAMLAVGLDLELGLDLEQVRPRRGALDIARRMFPAAVAERLAALPEEDLLGEFHVQWTRLEAGVKAFGGGLFDPASRGDAGLTRIGFVPAPGFQACVAGLGALPEPGRWRALAYVPPAETP